MKKIVALLLALTMLCSMAACGAKGGSAEPSQTASSADTGVQQPEQTTEEVSSEPTAQEASAEASASETAPEVTITYPVAEPVTLTALDAIYQPRTADKITSWSESLQYVEAAKATGITIDVTCVASSAQQEQTQLVVSSGDYPQLMTKLNMYYQVNDLVEQEIIIDLMPYLEAYAPDYYRTIQDMGYGRDIITDDGVSPCTYYVSEGVPNTGMMIRKDLLEKAGLDTPVTYEDYDDVMAAFKDQGVKEPFVLDGTSTGCSDVYNAGLEVQLYSHPILGSGNDGFYQVDGQVKFGYLEEGFVTYMTQMADWFQKGYISPDYISENENNNAETFTGKIVAGDVGAVTAGRTNLDTYNTEGKAVNPDFELVAIPSPRKEAGQVIHLGPYRQSSLNSGFYATSACSESDLEALLAWHNYWFTPDGDMLTNYGVEGLTYEMQDGKPVFTDMITNNADGLTLTQTTYIYIGQMGVVDNSREDQWYSDATVSAKDIWSENVDNAWKIPGACSMTADEANEYSSTFSDIQTYISEMLPKFIMGDEPIENLSAFQEQIQSMGIDTCIADWQSTLDRYNAR